MKVNYSHVTLNQIKCFSGVDQPVTCKRFVELKSNLLKIAQVRGLQVVTNRC